MAKKGLYYYLVVTQTSVCDNDHCEGTVGGYVGCGRAT